MVGGDDPPAAGHRHRLLPHHPRHRAGGGAGSRSRGIEAVAYSGDTDDDRRPGIEQALLANEVKVVVATSALGMGFDKPDLAFVIHYQSPGSPDRLLPAGGPGRAGAHRVARRPAPGRRRPRHPGLLHPSRRSRPPTWPGRSSSCWRSGPRPVRHGRAAGRGQRPADRSSTRCSRRSRSRGPSSGTGPGGCARCGRGRSTRTGWSRSPPCAGSSRRRWPSYAARRDLPDGGPAGLPRRRGRCRPAAGATSAPARAWPSTCRRAAVQAAIDHLRRAEVVIEPRKQLPDRRSIAGRPPTLARPGAVAVGRRRVGQPGPPRQAGRGPVRRPAGRRPRPPSSGGGGPTRSRRG